MRAGARAGGHGASRILLCGGGAISYVPPAEGRM